MDPYRIHPRVVDALKNPNLEEDLAEIANALQQAIELKRVMYEDPGEERERVGKCLFSLRKALEGIWGHDLPYLEEE